jgi:hypothetical protein
MSATRKTPSNTLLAYWAPKGFNLSSSSVDILLSIVQLLQVYESGAKRGC